MKVRFYSFSLLYKYSSKLIDLAREDLETSDINIVESELGTGLLTVAQYETMLAARIAEGI